MTRKIKLAASAIAVLMTTIAPISSASAQASILRPLTIQNSCHLPIRVYIYHADGYRNWHPHGPFNFSAYEAPIRLRNDGVILNQLDDHSLWIYAESFDGSKIWHGTQNVVYRGTTYRMMEANMSVSNGEAAVNITCP